jgi:hypothetical protein
VAAPYRVGKERPAGSHRSERPHSRGKRTNVYCGNNKALGYRGLQVGHNPGALGGAKGSGLLFDADTCSDIVYGQDGDRSRFSVATDDAVPSIAAYTVDGGKLVAISLVLEVAAAKETSQEPRLLISTLR